MADKYLNYTGLSYYHNRIKNEFADKDEFDTLSDKVDDLIAEGGEPNVIEVVKQNGTALTITNKEVNVEAPTMTINSAGNVIFSNGSEDYVQINANEDGALLEIGSGNEYSLASTDYVDENGGKIDVIKVNGTAQTITNKEVDLTVPTATSDLTNDGDGTNPFITQTVNNLTNYYTKSETYTQTEVDNLIGQLETIDIQVVQQLPTQDISTHTIYLLQVSQSPVSYDEYIYLAGDPTGHWEKIGSTDVDLTSYWTMTSGQNNSLVAITTAEIDTIVNA